MANCINKLSAVTHDPAYDEPRRTRLYLAGPMRGIPQFNFPAFYEAAKNLRAAGFEVWSPAENDVHQDGFDPTKEQHDCHNAPKTMSHYMARDLPEVCRSDAVAVLRGWQNSQGACLEVHVARNCGKPIIWAYDQMFVDFESNAPNFVNGTQYIGAGGAPMRASTLPESPQERKAHPVSSGVLDYFPDALVAIAHVSWKGNEQHNPGKPLMWDRSKSGDESDTLIRHFLQRGMKDTDGELHSAKMAWRALALLQKELESQ